MAEGGKPNGQRNGKLSIPLPFEDAVRAGLETKAPPKPPRKPRKKPAKKS
jgi:hypothetical protein